MLNDELNHRVKNILALVKSIARQTGATAASVEDYASAMEGRLRALAFAHDQSLQAGNGGDLRTLIAAEASLHRYGGETDRITADGPDIGLSDRSFGVVALVIHELMTNAAKYGALSVPDGRLKLSWRLNDNGDCRMTWLERRGPQVSTPTRTGFGTKLIQTTMNYDLGGSATVAYDPAGLSAELIVPASHLVDVADKAPAGATPVTHTHDVLNLLDVLLVEDQALIAIDTEDTVRKLGANLVRLAANVSQSKAEIAAAQPDFAILDYNLGSETSAEIADLLLDMAVPFLFVTGYGDNLTIPDRFKHVPIVRKPVSATALAARIEALRELPIL